MRNTTIDVLGTQYTIEIVNDGHKDLAEGLDGCCDRTSKRILILHQEKQDANDLDDPELDMRQTCRHEIIHAFLNESGLQSSWEHLYQRGHDETFVDWFAVQSPKLFKAFRAAGAAF